MDDCGVKRMTIGDYIRGCDNRGLSVVLAAINADGFMEAFSRFGDGIFFFGLIDPADWEQMLCEEIRAGENWLDAVARATDLENRNKRASIKVEEENRMIMRLLAQSEESQEGDDG